MCRKIGHAQYLPEMVQDELLIREGVGEIGDLAFPPRIMAELVRSGEITPEAAYARAS